MGENTAHLVHGKLVKEPLKDDDMMVAKSIGVELRRVLDIERKVTAPKARFLEHWVKAGFDVGKIIAFGSARAVYMEKDGLEKGKTAQKGRNDEAEGKKQGHILTGEATCVQGAEPCGGRKNDKSLDNEI